MAKIEATAAQLLSRFFDDLEEVCPSQDGPHEERRLEPNPEARHLLQIVKSTTAQVVQQPGHVEERSGLAKASLASPREGSLGRSEALDIIPPPASTPGSTSSTSDPLRRILEDIEEWLQHAALAVPPATVAGGVKASQAAPAGFSNWSSAPESSLRPGKKSPDAYERQVLEDVNATARRQELARPPMRAPDPDGGDGDEGSPGGRSKGGGGAGRSILKRRVLGGPLLVQEMKPMLTNIHTMSYLGALNFSIAHCWQSHFGIMGPDAEEGEDPRVRGLVSNTSPAVLLCELNALASFNMMDPILSYNYEFLMDTARLLHKRTRHGNNSVPGRTPLGYVVQGAGPHFCPGGNHHPVSPPGGTPLSMHINTGSNPFIYNRECNLPSITCYTGSVIGGGVALGLQQTHRVAASSASMAFGNISRGACPVMFLSQNLPTAVGTPGAVEIYLTDMTISACKGQRVGMLSQVLPSFAAVKTRAMQMTKKMASTPAVRLVNQVRPLMDYSRYQREAMGMTLAMRTGALFANVKSARWKREDAEEEQHAAQADVTRTVESSVPVAESDTGCAQCGQRGAAGFQHGKAFFCQSCWPLSGVARPQEPAAVNLTNNVRGARVAFTGSTATMSCAECGGSVRAGSVLEGADGLWYCDLCWARWHAGSHFWTNPGDGVAEAATDVGTDHTEADSATEGTIIGSDCITCSDVWSDEEM
mmetsp:Transcript_40079/g.93041  ORF Transcript_40079/g.93041 Transcript_40079/m.93041 type:complete len:704 (+) Transcript_40079:58-2169(+)